MNLEKSAARIKPDHEGRFATHRLHVRLTVDEIAHIMMEMRTTKEKILDIEILGISSDEGTWWLYRDVVHYYDEKGVNINANTDY